MSKIKGQSKAQGLSVTVIIIAALGLAILFILLYATSTKLKFFGKGVKEYELKKCSEVGVKKPLYECDKPLLGDYGKINASGQLVPLGPDEVCCAE